MGIPGGFIIADFTIDHTTRTVTCKGCPLRAQCTTATRGRTLQVHPNEYFQRRQRTKAEDPEFKDLYRSKRPMVERSIAWLTRGNRKVPYRGQIKNDNWSANSAAVINLKRLLALGLTQQCGHWAIP